MTGINRTVIDKKIKAESFLDIIKSLALPKKIDTKFLYPTTEEDLVVFLINCSTQH